MGDGREWSWVGEDGVEHVVSEDQLTFALSAEELPAYTLVCRDGWAEWLPAMQVAELRWALPPGQADTPRKPARSEGSPRQAPPLATYKTLRFRAGEIAAGRINPDFEAQLALSPVAPRTGQLAGLSRYSDNDPEEPTVQLESEALFEGKRGTDSGTESLPPPAPPSSPSQPDGILDAATSPASSPPDAPHASPKAGPTLPPRSRRSGPAARPHLGLWAAGAALVILLVGVVVWLKSRASAPAPVTPAPALPTLPDAPVQSHISDCSITQGPRRLGEFAKADLRPGIAELSSGKLAIGYGQTSRYAVGLVVDPKTLVASRVFSDYSKSPLVSVTPMAAEGEPQFLFERAASALQSARTIAATPPFTLGLLHGKLAVRSEENPIAETIWNSPFESFTVPQSVRLDAKRHAVALRGGGERGSVLVGTLQESAKPLGALVAVEAGVARVSEPYIAVATPGSDVARVAVVFAGGEESATEQLWLAQATPPELPARAERLSVGSAPLYEPSVGALTDGSFLVQWAEGSPGAQTIRLAHVSPELEARGEVLQISGPGVDARDGVLFVSKRGVLSVYMVRNGQNHEMWGASLLCR